MPRQQALTTLATFLAREGVSPAATIEFLEFDTAPVFQVSAEEPELVRKLAGALGCPERDLPDPDQAVVHPDADWRGEVDLAQLVAEFRAMDGPGFQLTLTVEELFKAATPIRKRA